MKEKAKDHMKKLVLQGHSTHDGAGVKLTRIFAHDHTKLTDPFLLLDHFGSDNPDDYVKGFPWHPHRGIETVTYMLGGMVEHGDNIGNAGTIGPGDIQWMTAGGGVIHQEMPKPTKGMMHGLQLWVNLPAKNKMTPAKYQAIENKDMMRINLNDGKSFVELISGEYNGIKGPAFTFSPVNLFNAKMVSGGRAEFNFSSKFNTGMLVIEGEIKINESKPVSENNFVLFGHDGEDIVIEAIKDSIVLVLSGQPINEPIASYGPFVMNTEAEIKQAYKDYNDGKFGYLED